jgi:cellobiose transport system substrate-binding protein
VQRLRAGTPAHLDGVRARDDPLLLIEEARMPGTRRLRTAAAAIFAASLIAAIAGCSSSQGRPAPERAGPLITLRIGVYGDPGYRQAGLYAEYERLHPNIKIIQDDTARQASYWPRLLSALKSGHADDIEAVPAADMSAVTGPLAGDFVRLNAVAGRSPGGGVAGDWLPWVARQTADGAGNTYALGAEIGPVAVCYRTDLMAEAGLPTSPAVLARDWSTWAGYLRLGRAFKAHIPAGPAFTDSVSSLYNVMISQAREQYYGPSGSLVVGANPAIKAAWATAVQAAQDGLSAKLTPQSAAWEQGVTRGSFATVLCPAWMLPQIAKLSGQTGSGQWNVTTAPGAAGDSGGFYLALPRAGRHQSAAFRLAAFLTGERAGAALFRAEGGFPANLMAVRAVSGVRDRYFSDAKVGKIFGHAADLTPVAITGPASQAIAADLDSDLTQVEIGHVSAALAWQAALRQARAATSAGP